jgi:L-amino acid N-acyltransferase YncA
VKAVRNSILRAILSGKRPTKADSERRLMEGGEEIGDFTIREATAQDITELAQVHETAWAQTYPDVKRPPGMGIREPQWRQQFAVGDGSWICYVVVNPAGRIVGFIKGKKFSSSDLPGYDGEIHKIYLLQAHQRLGLGRRMLGHPVRRFLSMGIDSMVLYGVAENPSIAFHEAMGGEKLLNKKGGFDGGDGWKHLARVALLCPIVGLEQTSSAN